MKKLLVVLALLTVSTLGYAVEVVPDGSSGIYIIDGKKVYLCHRTGCRVISTDYSKSK